MHTSVISLLSFLALAGVYAFFAHHALARSERLAGFLQIVLLVIIAGTVGYIMLAHIEKAAIISAV